MTCESNVLAHAPGADHRRPMVELLTLAAPTVAQMASYTVLQFTDTYMLALVSPVHATAAGNAGMFAFSFIGFGMGVLHLVNTLASQSFGAQRFEQCGRYLWQGVWFSVAFALLILPTIAVARFPFVWSGHEPELASMEVTYYRVMLCGAVFKLTSMAFGQFLLAVNRPGLVLVAAATSVPVNVLANWVLIYGNWGSPAMGVAGAAWGTNLALLSETIILAAFAFGPAVGRRFGVFDWRLRFDEMKTLLKVGTPAGGQFVADITAWTLFMMTVMGVFGTAAMAANTFAFRFWVASFMPAFGISSAVTALVGRYIGMGRPDLAARRAHLGFFVGATYMVSCGVVFLLLRYRFMRLFTEDPEIIRIGATVLVFAAIFQFFDALYVIYNGALRGAGDTLVPAVAVLVLCWGITVFGGYAVAKTFPQFGPAGPWFMAMLYGIVLGAFIFTRFQRGHWRSIRLEHGGQADRLPGFEPIVAK
ncbi:MAG: MATE family efflux transporter [Tepidisphaeraceae bacterium]